MCGPTEDEVESLYVPEDRLQLGNEVSLRPDQPVVVAPGVVDDVDDLHVTVDLSCHLVDGDVSERVLPAVQHPGGVHRRLIYHSAEQP